MIESGQTWEFVNSLGDAELFTVLEVVIKGKTNASASVGYCKLLRLDGPYAGLVMWEWEYKLALEGSVGHKSHWRRFA